MQCTEFSLRMNYKLEIHVFEHQSILTSCSSTMIWVQPYVWTRTRNTSIVCQPFLILLKEEKGESHFFLRGRCTGSSELLRAEGDGTFSPSEIWWSGLYTSLQQYCSMSLNKDNMNATWILLPWKNLATFYRPTMSSQCSCE